MIVAADIFTVSEITNQIKQTLEEDFSQVSVVGEISNFKPHHSGHWYFNLKDSKSVICCTMWRGNNNYVFFTPQDGMKIVVKGRITVYPPKGNYQIDVRSMKPAGAGELQAAFELLKQKLASEGLFDVENKKPIPAMPKKIGIVAASDGAAIKDMISVAARRFPLVELVLCHTKVQGIGAAENIVQSIKSLNKKKDIDVIILGRGGGSMEDLWAFNEEIVARAIFKSRIPVISGVGHEIDFTIADFVADRRAATPSVAMEIATPDQADFFAFINEFSYNSNEKLKDLCYSYRERIKRVFHSYGFRMPMDLLRSKSQYTDNLLYRLLQNTNRILTHNKNRLSLLKNSIESHNVEKILKKGFILVRQDSKFVTRSKNFNPVKTAELNFYDGKISVYKSEPENKNNE